MKYYEDKSDRKMELKLLSLSEDDKLIRECMEQASAFYGCLGEMGVKEILCDRKKAQELGADCQITGIFTGGELTAFACAFEYTGLKRNGRKWLNPGDKEWRQIETLGTNVVVIPLLVGKEKVGRLIELLREQYRDSHLLFRISGEQSEKFQEDLAVVSEKNLKSHRYDAAGENVWLFHFAPQIRMEDTYFEEEILLILPGQEVLLEMGIEEAEVTMVELTGYEIVRSEKGSAFFRKPGAACEGVLLQCDYEQLLRYQRFINLTNYEEHFEQTDRGKALIYSEKYQSDSSLLWNDLLREMVKTRKAEWRIVPDSYIMYPVTYKDHEDYLKHYWKHIVISLLLLILILGYVPPFKKRFARSIKKRPSIECSAEKIGLRDNVMKGNFEKDLASRLLPYVPETGRLTFSPTPVKKTAKVRASGGGSMLILNTSAFAGKEEITFNGMSIQENEKGHHRISASTIIVVSTPEFTYTCIPNVQRTANGEIKRGKRK